jgi:NTP-dependent ternary system trypsin peptidase co-occuring protein
MSGNGLGLAEFIREIKRELMESEQGADDSTKLLVIEDIELDIQVGVSFDGRAGINVQVLQLGGSAKHDDVHTVKVKLQPLLNHQERVQQLQRDPHWSEYVKASTDFTVKGLTTHSNIGAF